MYYKSNRYKNNRGSIIPLFMVFTTTIFKTK